MKIYTDEQVTAVLGELIELERDVKVLTAGKNLALSRIRAIRDVLLAGEKVKVTLDATG